MMRKGRKRYNGKATKQAREKRQTSNAGNRVQEGRK
jgi:hypothetical protein